MSIKQSHKNEHKNELLEGLLGEKPTQKRSQMGIVERLMLSPWEKWTKHRRFPNKIVLHLMLLGLTIAQLSIYDAQNAAYMRASHRNWAFFFLPLSDVGVDARFQRDIYSLNKTINSLAYIRDAYFTIGNTSVANYEYHVLSSGEIRPIQMEIEHFLSSGEIKTNTYHIQKDSLGPFKINPPIFSKESQMQKAFLRSIQSIRLTFFLRDRQHGNYYDECFDWGIELSLKKIAASHMRVLVEECTISSCTHRSFWHALKRRFVWLNMIIAVLCVVYMVLSFKSLMRSYHFVSQAHEMLLKESKKMKPVPLTIKFKLINRLQVLVLLSLSFVLISACWNLIFLKSHVPISYWHRIVQATGMLMLWSCLVGYLEHNQHIYSIVLTLRWGIPRVFQFLIGVSPIFMGYALFGNIYFGTRIKEFGDLSASSVTLFSVMNGDVILDTFDSFQVFYPMTGKIYLYSFICLFIYVVLNIFVAIIEEAFFATRSCRRMLDILTNPNVVSENNNQHPPEISSEMVRTLLRLVRMKKKDIEEHKGQTNCL